MEKHLSTLILLFILVTFITFLPLRTEVLGVSKDDEKLQGENQTGCVEVLEAKKGSTSCSDAKGISMKLKVNCDKPVDVRLCYKGKKSWVCNTYTNRKSGDEIPVSECNAKGSYVIYKRDAGSNVEFPNPK